MRFIRKPRFLFVYPLAVWMIIGGDITEPSLRLGIVLVVIGETIRLWANGYVGNVKVNWTQRWRDDPKIGHLITAGPYAYVRNPLYLGTFMVGFGFCIIVQNVWLVLAALVCFFMLYGRKAEREEAMLLDELGAEYETYRRAVPRWFPTFRGYARSMGQWSWRGIQASREWKTIIWITVMVVALYFWEESVQEHEFLFDERLVMRGILFGMVLALMIVDGIMELMKRRSVQTSASTKRVT